MRRFDPRDLGKVAVWVDAQDFGTLTLSGSDITGLADKSGNGNNFVVGTGVSMVYNATAMNGKPGLVSTAMNLKLVHNSTMNWSASTIFMVAERNNDSGSGENRWFWSWVVAGQKRFIFGSNDDTDKFYYTITANGTSADVNTIDAAIVDDTPLIFVAVNDGSNSHPRVDGSEFADENAIFGTGTDDWNIGHASAGRNNTFGEIIVYTELLSRTNILKVEQYLSQKWGIPL